MWAIGPGFPEAVSNPVKGLLPLLHLSGKDKTVRARLQKWLTTVKAPGEDEKMWLPRGSLGRIALENKIRHNWGFKVMLRCAPPEYF